MDVIDRWVDIDTGQLHTKRLILKRGIIPKWASKWLPAGNMSGGRGLDAWILEESVVDPPGWERNGGGEHTIEIEDIAESSVMAVGRSQPRMAERRAAQGQMQGRENGQYSAVDGHNMQPRLRFSQGNLNHRKFMHVVESGELCEGRSG